MLCYVYQLYYTMYTCTGCPSIVRSDYGTENASLSGIQIAFGYRHHGSLRATKRFMYGTSKSNIVSIPQYYGCITIVIVQQHQLLRTMSSYKTMSLQ